jgi:uncharacterized protein (DUF1499 family)
MSFIFASLLAIALFLFPSFNSGAIAAPAATTVGTLPGLEGVFAGETPELGLKDGQLFPCPDKPNCVVSQGADETHQIEPISYTRDRDAARDLLVKVLGVVPRTEVVTQTDDYLRAKATSRLMGFVDDLEFYFPKEESVIHLRSAARLGESELTVAV